MSYSDIRKIRSNVAENLSGIRKKLNMTQERIAKDVFSVTRQTWNNWENDGTLDYGIIYELREYLLAGEFKCYGGFEIEDFFTKKIDFDAIDAQKTPLAFNILSGAYILYYPDTADNAATHIETPRFEPKYYVLYLTEKSSLTLSSELAAYAAHFKNYREAMDFLERLEAHMANISDRTEYAEQAQAFYKANSDNTKGARENYVGRVKFLQGNHFFVINLNNMSNTDDISIYLFAPDLSSRYPGGLGLMASVSSGNPPRPSSNKVVLARGEINYHPEKMNTFFPAKISDIPINSELRALFATYDALKKERVQLHMDSEDIENFIIYKVKQIIDRYNAALNLCSIDVEAEEDADLRDELENHTLPE